MLEALKKITITKEAEDIYLAGFSGSGFAGSDDFQSVVLICRDRINEWEWHDGSFSLNYRSDRRPASRLLPTGVKRCSHVLFMLCCEASEGFSVSAEWINTLPCPQGPRDTATQLVEGVLCTAGSGMRLLLGRQLHAGSGPLQADSAYRWAEDGGVDKRRRAGASTWMGVCWDVHPLSWSYSNTCKTMPVLSSESNIAPPGLCELWHTFTTQTAAELLLPSDHTWTKCHHDYGLIQQPSAPSNIQTEISHQLISLTFYRQLLCSSHEV